MKIYDRQEIFMRGKAMRKSLSTKLILGWLLLGLSIAMLSVHSFFTFVANTAPYNLAKGHLEVGIVGSLLFMFGLTLSNPKYSKTFPIQMLIIVLTAASGLMLGNAFFK